MSEKNILAQYFAERIKQQQKSVIVIYDEPKEGMSSSALNMAHELLKPTKKKILIVNDGKKLKQRSDSYEAQTWGI